MFNIIWGACEDVSTVCMLAGVAGSRGGGLAVPLRENDT